MPSLPDKPTLQDLQVYVSQLEAERGFDVQTVRDKCLLLGEEVGELFKSIRKAEGLTVDPQSEIGETAHELADILIFLCAIANRYGIDLETAFRSKESLNHQRIWQATGGHPISEQKGS